MRKKRPATPAQLLKRDQIKVARLEAKLQARQYEAALSYYAAADTGRRFKDWRASPISADSAIIPDALLTCARARTMVANSSLGRAAVRSQKRNVVGRGIMVIPVAKGPDGKELTELNQLVSRLWMKWASSKICDLEEKRTYWQFQRMTISEEFVTGMSMLVTSYQPNPKIVGLRLQAFEYEQLVREILSYTGVDATGMQFTNEVRGGVEVNENGAPVAFHFYRRNPNDYSFYTNYVPFRVTVDQVLAYYDAERVHQSTGISQMAPVLAEMRNTQKINGAVLDRNYMESCIGLGIEKGLPTVIGSPFGPPARAGDTGTTASGMRKIDFTPGMVPELMPGEKFVQVGMNAPGNTYEPFMEQNKRQIGAGMGMSYGALTRHNDGNYSAARQDMLEDEREIEPQQDALIDHQICPVYERWFALAVYEGRLPVNVSEFAAEPDRFLEAEYVPPARPWIDPEKEANAYKVALEQRIITRKEIIAMRGGTFSTVLRQIAEERDEADTLDITFPEDVLPPAPGAPPPEDTTSGDAGGDATDTGQMAKADAPNYRPLNDPTMNCGNCKYFQNGACTAYDFNPTPSSVCDSFARGSRMLPPGPQPGEMPINTFDPAASDVRQT